MNRFGLVLTVLNEQLFPVRQEHILGLNKPNVHPILQAFQAEDDHSGHFVLYVSRGTNSRKENFWFAQNRWGEEAHDKGTVRLLEYQAWNILRSQIIQPSKLFFHICVKSSVI